MPKEKELELELEDSTNNSIKVQLITNSDLYFQVRAGTWTTDRTAIITIQQIDN